MCSSSCSRPSGARFGLAFRNVIKSPSIYRLSEGKSCTPACNYEREFTQFLMKVRNIGSWLEVSGRFCWERQCCPGKQIEHNMLYYYNSIDVQWLDCTAAKKPHHPPERSGSDAAV